MKIDSEESSDYFGRRFHSCDDGVIRRLEIIFRSGAGYPGRAVVVLSVRDVECKENRGFVNLRIDLLQVSEFRFKEDSVSYQVLSEGLKFGFFENSIFLTFNPYDNPQTPMAFRNSEFYIIAKQLEWSVLPYKEYEG